MKYLENHEVESADIIVASSVSPKTAPTTTSMRLKNPPEPIPFTIAKDMVMPSEFVKGHNAKAERPTSSSERIMLFTGLTLTRRLRKRLLGRP